MMSGSPFSIPNANAGAPSLSRFSHSSWIAVRGGPTEQRRQEQDRDLRHVTRDQK